ncbi:LysR substrate-binding domain-containing protein [Rhodoferax aquaticus]|uniref:LysR family transcriptional regulator n=1 Tax=Rhodoferax aquaticus TaxID=2527691 RepID=A0A515EMT7_9BURK|nr:LysR substrate-binding domain-containing protein [Rhodoferax aquaticus]QDL53987.1 LysR family transcriptional regulator [Rhodoferax aquaticus]
MRRLPPLNALRAFSVAAQTASFTKAGELLHVTQGAISRQVKQLEEAVGQPLFMRAHQGLVLTPVGKDLAASLEDVFAQLESAVDRAAQAVQRQLLAVNVPPTFATRWLAPRLSDFRARYPMIDLSITTDWVQKTRDAQNQDCLVVFGSEAWPKVQTERLMVEQHIMVSSPVLWRNDLPPSLSNATLLHILNGEERLPVWEHWIAVHGLSHVDPQPGLAFSTLDQVINAAVAGAGVAVVDQAMVVRELQSGVLRRHSQQQMSGPCGYWFIDVSHKPERQALARLFHDWLLTQFHRDQSMALLAA